MRAMPVLLLLAALVLAHGERSTTNPNPGNNPVITGPRRGTGDGTGGRGGGPTTTPRAADGVHDWRIWWAYNREWILAARARARPVTGIARSQEGDSLTRRKLREGELIDVMRNAIRDKNQRVRAAAAVALGKFGMTEAQTDLRRRRSTPPAKWYTVREASIFGLAALGLAEERTTFLRITGDKERTITDRSLALLSLLLDGTEESSDEIVARTKFFRSGVKATAGTLPTNDEQERRRFAGHLLGFSKFEHDELLWAMAKGSRKWGPGEQGLAITALGRRANQEYKDGLFRLAYARSSHDSVKQSVAIALGRMLKPTGRDDIRRLGRLLRDAKRDSITQHFAAISLGRIGGPHAVEMLLELARNDVFNNDADRAFLYLGLGLAGGRSDDVKSFLTARFQRARTDELRSVLALACGLANAKDVLPALENRLDKSSPKWTRPASGLRRPPGPTLQDGGFLKWGTLALGMLGATSKADKVRAIFKKYHHPAIRESAAISLALLKGRASVRGLVDVLKDAGSMHSKAAVVTALGLLPEPSRDAVDALVDAYKDDSNQDTVRAMAIIALGAMADPRPVALSALLTRDYNYFIRSYALDWIAALL